MEKVNELKEALCDVRKAHRIIYSYQARMLDLVRFIKAKLDFDYNIRGTAHFSDDIWRSDREGYLKLNDDTEAWDFLFSYVFEYHLGNKAMTDRSIAFSIIQYSDTGSFEGDETSFDDFSTFRNEEQSGSKLLFFIEMAPKKKKNFVWDIEDIVFNKEYGSIHHEKTVLEKNGCVQGLYSFPIERFIDEKSTLEALQEFLDFCKENDIAELEIM